MDFLGEKKEQIYAKVFRGSSSDFSFAQKMVTLYVTNFTLRLYDVENDKFSKACKSEETFTAFFMECFEEKTEKR